MRITAWPLLPMVTCFALACAGSESDTTDVIAPTATQDEPTEDEPTEDEPTDAVAQSPWRDTSTHLALLITPSFAVSSHFEASPAQLREDQLQALRGLRLEENPPKTPCGDCPSYNLSITDADGGIAHYGIRPNPAAQPPLDGVIALDSLQPFLDTFNCYSTGSHPFGGRDSAPQSWEHAPTLSTADSSCSHGILHYPCDQMRFWLAVEQPGQYQISSVDCAPDLSVELMTEGLSPLASAAFAGAECPVITHEFADVGSYALLLGRADDGACDEPRSQAYYQLRVTASVP
jgi:hypothetical protein